MGPLRAATTVGGCSRRRSSLLVASVLFLVPASGCTSDSDQSHPKPTDATSMASGSETMAEPAPVPWKRIQAGRWSGNQPPLAGEPITLELMTAGPARQGHPYPFIVRIGNSGGEPVSLEPCPAFRMQYLPHVEVGSLNCEAAPDAISPGEHVDFQMQIDVLDLGLPRVTGFYVLLWQLGGEGFEGKTARKRVRLTD